MVYWLCTHGLRRGLHSDAASRLREGDWFRIVRLPYCILVPIMAYSNDMGNGRKITLEIPPELLDKAQKASGTGITQTVRMGLQLVAASRTYARLRSLRGKVRFSRSLADLKADR